MKRLHKNGEISKNRKCCSFPLKYVPYNIVHIETKTRYIIPSLAKSYMPYYRRKRKEREERKRRGERERASREFLLKLVGIWEGREEMGRMREIWDRLLPSSSTMWVLSCRLCIPYI